MNDRNKNYWPMASYCSLMVFTNVTIFVVLNTKLNFALYAAVVIIPLVFWSVLK